MFTQNCGMQLPEIKSEFLYVNSKLCDINLEQQEIKSELQDINSEQQEIKSELPTCFHLNAIFTGFSRVHICMQNR